MRKWKEELLDQRRKMMEEKLLHAEFKRELQLQAIVKKAQEEEAKVGFNWVSKGAPLQQGGFHNRKEKSAGISDSGTIILSGGRETNS